MTARGKVVRLSGAGGAVVRIARETACGKSCASCGACGERMLEVMALNRAGAKPGDTVDVESSSGKTLWLCFIVYLLPVLLFISGWLIHPAAGVAMACLSMAVAFMFNGRLKKTGGLKMEIVRIVGTN